MKWSPGFVFSLAVIFLPNCSLYSSSTISQINCWEQVNSWKNLWKSWNGSLCRNKSGTYFLLNVAAYWKNSSIKVRVKKLFRMLASNTDNGARKVSLRIYVRYCLKKPEKSKGVWKSWALFSLKLTLLNAWGKSFMTNYFSAWRLWPSKNLSVKIDKRYNGFLLLKENILSIQSVLFLDAILPKYKKFSLFYHWIPNKVVRKVRSTDRTI